jgi:glycolate oxidase
VPVDRLAELLAAIDRVGARHRLETAAWGHAGDGNVHATFCVDRTDGEELDRAECAAGELFDAALALGGTISGEHGLGTVKQRHLSSQLDAGALRLHRTVKRALDPAGILNPATKATGGTSAPQGASAADGAQAANGPQPGAGPPR